MKVTPSIAPEVRLNKNQLKKLDNLDASFGSLSSNWSAPKAGKAALTPLVPNATRELVSIVGNVLELIWSTGLSNLVWGSVLASSGSNQCSQVLTPGR
ncbi:hypothetical protein A2U01_0033948, partial [Trifolium medium]|nr:hypothetical protein [Trifolium medium]